MEDIEVDIRIIAATNKDLEKAVKEKKFREDLYYRLNVVPIEVPPLRERGSDILLIAEYFLGKFNRCFQKEIKGFDESCRRKLLSYSWPGNIRELKNVIERIVILSNEEWIQTKKLPSEIQNFEGDNDGVALEQENHVVGEEGFSLDDKLDSIERCYLVEALEKFAGNQTKASEWLGVSRFALRRKIEKHMLQS